MSEKNFSHHFEGSQEKAEKVFEVLKLIRETQSERGNRSEQIAVRALEHLKESGFLEEVLVISRGTKIDRMGIDMICKKTLDGYYFINIKSSFKGVEHHMKRKLLLQLREKPVYEIYPIAINLLESPESLEKRLQNVFNAAPSSDTLPLEIKTALDELPAGPAAKKEQKDRVKENKKIELTVGEVNSIRGIIKSKLTAQEKIQQLQNMGFINNLKITTEQFFIGRRGKARMWVAKVSLSFLGQRLSSVVETPLAKTLREEQARDAAYYRIIARIEKIVSENRENMIQ